MSKTSKRAILTIIVIATLLTVMIPIIPVSAAVPEGLTFVTDGSGTATWTTDEAHTGSYSVELYAPASTGDYGKIVLPVADMDFAGFDFSVYVEGGATSQALPLLDIMATVAGSAVLPASNKVGTPYDGDGEDLDSKIVVLASQPGQSEDLSPTLMTDDVASWELYGTHDGADIEVGDGTEEYWSIFVYSSSYVYEAAYDYYTWDQICSVLDGTATVKEVRVELRYPQDESGDVASTVYIDDIEINGVTYNLELVAGTGFSIDEVSPSDNVDYGDTLTVFGSGVTAGSTVNVYWDYVTAANLLSVTTGKPSGEFECEVDVPSAVYGNHYLWVKDLSSGISVRSDAISVVPKITLTPSSGLEGDDIIVKGYGFSEDSEIAITFAPTTLSDDGTDETDDLGYFEYTFEVGVINDGTYAVSAKDPFATIVSAPFIVGAAITLDKEVGPAGTIVKVEGRGFDFVDTILTEVAITLVNSTGSYAVDTKDGEDIITSGTGTFTVYVVIPSVEIGDYELTINGGAGKVATAEFEVDGETSITVTPGYGTPGTVLTVKGYNFTRISGEDVLLEIEDQTAEATTDASGSFTATIVVPPLDFGVRYPVSAKDERNCEDSEMVLVALIVLQLSDYSAPVGAEVMLMGSGFTKGDLNGKWNATIGDIDLIETTDIGGEVTYFSHYWYVPSLPAGTYTINVRDIEEEIVVGIDFTVTDPATLSVSRASIPNKYNLTIEGINFVEKVDVKTEWWIYNSTDAWNIDDNVTYGGDDSYPKTDEDGEFTGYYGIPEFLEIGSYTINCTTISNAEVDPDIIQFAEVDIEIVPEELVIHIGSPSYARGQTITFVIKTTLKKVPFDLGIKDPEGSEFFNSTWDEDADAWKTLGSWFYIPSNLQIDTNTKWLYTLPIDATPGTWTYSFWDEDKEYANGTFQVTYLTELEQLQQDIGEVMEGIEGMGTSFTELGDIVSDLSDDSAAALEAAAAAAAAAADAKAAADASTAAISDVEDMSSDALDAANDAKSAADAAKTAADSGLAAANDAKATSQAAVDAANTAADAAEASQKATGGLTTLVYGAIAASLIAALAAIVSLMQISKRIAG